MEYSTALWTDSSRIHGVPQRYLTRYLRAQLTEQRFRQDRLLGRIKTKVGLRRQSDLKDSGRMSLTLSLGDVWGGKAAQAEEVVKDTERRIRLVDREILPLIQGVAERAKAARHKRIVAKVSRHLNDIGATALERSLLRKHLVQDVEKGWPCSVRAPLASLRSSLPHETSFRHVGAIGVPVRPAHAGRVPWLPAPQGHVLVVPGLLGRVHGRGHRLVLLLQHLEPGDQVSRVDACTAQVEA